jgi:sugar phosphate permease
MPSPPESAIETRVLRKVIWRLVPFMMLLYMFNYLDRINISVAKLAMNPDLGMNEKMYGIGTAMFFIGYFFFEVPSNIMLERFGARIWIARIMISWGVVSAAFMFVKGATSFYLMRLLLGATEAGFFPGIVLFLTYWIPARKRAKVGAIFMTSIPLAGVIGQPLSSWIMESLNGVCGLKGWQWIFIVEGIPTILLGCTVYFFLTEKPANAKWLSPAQREWLSTTIESENALTRGSHGHHSLLQAMGNRRVWLLSLIYMALMFGFYPINYWTTTIVKESLDRDAQSGTLRVGLLSAVPFAAAIAGMVVISIIADRTGKRRGVMICSATAGVAGLVLAAYTQTTATTVAALSLAAVGVFGSLSPFWTLPSAFLTGTAAAAAIAFINSWGNLAGGFIGNLAMGALKDHYTGKVERPYMYGLLVDAAVLSIGIVLALGLRMRPANKGSEDLRPEALPSASK